MGTDPAYHERIEVTSARTIDLFRASTYHWLGTSLWLLVSAVFVMSGCESSDSALSGDLGATHSHDVGPMGPTLASVTLVLDHAPLPTAPNAIGPLRFRAEPLTGGPAIDRPLEITRNIWPQEVQANDLPPGRYTLTVYHDRAGDGVLDSCPFPPSPRDPERADDFDNVAARLDVRVEDAARFEMRIERQICGPGDFSTGLKGQIEGPGPDNSTLPIYLYLEPHPPAGLGHAGGVPEQDDAGVNTGTATMMSAEPAALRIPLFPDGVVGVAEFDIGQLLPGRYRAVFFADADADRTPTPCSSGLGGADRFLAMIDDLQIEGGRRVAFEAPVSLVQTPSCPDDLTGVSGEITLSPALAELIEGDATLADPLGLLGGPIRLAFIPAYDDGMTADSVALFPNITALGTSSRFTVTGLEPGVWRIAAFIDRDDDARFGPCGGLHGGLDAVFHAIDEVRVDAGRVADLGLLELALASDCDTDLNGFRGTIMVGVEPGSRGSGRPVRLELYPETDSLDRLSLLLFENHWSLVDLTTGSGEPTRFTVAGEALPGGSYQARIFLDTNRDGMFSDCRDAPFGDRGWSQVFDVEITEGVVAEIGLREITVVDTAACPLPESGVEPTIVPPFGDRPFPEGAALRLAISEDGGWHDDLLLRSSVDDEAQAWHPPIQSLAPGHYRLTAYLDTAPDGMYGPCGTERPDRVAGVVHIVVDEADPVPRPEIALSLSCD